MSQTIKFAYQSSVFEVGPTIEHSAYSSFPGFVQYETGCSYPQILHNVRVVLTWKNLSEQIPAISLTAVKQQGYLVEEAGEPKIVVAEALIKEYPVRWRQKMGVSWSEWLARFDEDSTAIGIRADEIVHGPDHGHCLCEGSLYLLDKLDVHPLFRGQRVGLHLCRYVLNVIPKTDSDMIFLLADPIDSKYENGNYNRITDINRLAEYYVTAGFRYVRVQPDGQILMEARGSDPQVRFNLAYIASETAPTGAGIHAHYSAASSN